MTELEYVIAGFSDRFASFHDKRIVLHGSRNYAEAIIENFADSFNFVGILSLLSIVFDWMIVEIPPKLITKLARIVARNLFEICESVIHPFVISTIPFKTEEI